MIRPNPNEQPWPAEANYVRDYQLVKEIGKGGMGTVYEAIHTRLNKRVAVKILPQDRVQNIEAVGRFEREIKAVGKLDHPNIVRAYDAGLAQGMHYLVMEYVDGHNLSALASGFGPLPVPAACELIRQACEGLEQISENGFVHRDIKPSNLMVTPNGRVKILDLGLALLPNDFVGKDEWTLTGQIVGTLDYMAPEQLCESHSVDIRADIYGLGATLFKLLAGQVPHADSMYDTPEMKMAAILAGPARAISECRADVPKPLVVILNRLLAKCPDHRYATPAEVARALLPFANGNDLPRLVSSVSTVFRGLEGDGSTLAHASSGMTETIPAADLAWPRQDGTNPSLHQKLWFLAWALPLLIVGAGVAFFAAPHFAERWSRAVEENDAPLAKVDPHERTSHDPIQPLVRITEPMTVVMLPARIDCETNSPIESVHASKWPRGSVVIRPVHNCVPVGIRTESLCHDSEDGQLTKPWLILSFADPRTPSEVSTTSVTESVVARCVVLSKHATRDADRCTPRPDGTTAAEPR